MISKKPKFMAIFSAIIICFLLAIPAHSALAETTTQTVDLTNYTHEARLELAKYLIKNQQADKAILVIRFKKFTIKKDIILAQNLLADGLFLIDKKDDAIAVLRRLLSAYPSLTMVRYKLARMLYVTEDDSAAKHHFQILRASISNEKSQLVIDKYLKQLDLRKRWFFSVGGNVLPKSNINDGTKSDIYYCEDTASTPEGIAAWTALLASFGLDCLSGIPIAESQQAQSGIVLTGNVSGGYRFRVADDASWTIRATGEYFRYPTTPDVITLALNSGPTIAVGNRTKLNINGGASISISNQAIVSSRYGVDATLDHIFSPKLWGRLNARIHRTDIFANPNYSNITAALNGSVQISIDNSSYVKLLAGISKGEYSAPNLSFWKYSGGIGVYKEFGYGITIYSEFDLAFKDKPVEDVVEYAFQTKLTKRDFNFMGFSPQLIYTYTRSDSNINRNDTDGHSVTVGITRAF